MIHPSYTELIQAINNNAEEDDNTMMLNSRYSLVLATSKRARQLIAGAEPLVSGTAGKKPLAIAIDELYKGQVKKTKKKPKQQLQQLRMRQLQKRFLKHRKKPQKKTPKFNK